VFAQPTLQAKAVVLLYDSLALVLRFHARESHAATHAVDVTKYARGNDRAVRSKHLLEVGLGDIARQIGDVEICRILFLLLQQNTQSSRTILIKPFYNIS